MSEISTGLELEETETNHLLIWKAEPKPRFLIEPRHL
jgi:hypothetical protein